MLHKIKVDITSRSRKGNSRLRAIVVVTGSETISRDQLQVTRNSTKTLSPDKNGIMWLVTNEAVTVKVYTIK